MLFNPEKWIAALLLKLGLPADELIVASAHFHAHIVYGLLLVILGYMTGHRGLLWVGPLVTSVWVLVPEAGPTGRWVDVAFRAAGALVVAGVASVIYWITG